MRNQKQYEEYILELIIKLKNNEATEAEIKAIDHWYDHPASPEKYTDGMSALEKSQAQKRIFKSVNSRINTETFSRDRLISRSLVRALALAAVLLLIVGARLFYWLPDSNSFPNNSSSVTSAIKPGGSKAMLTLANGRQIILSDTRNGIVASQGNITVSKSDNNKIVYKTGNSLNSKVEYNTISTLRGGEYQLILSDGTKVWLNAASSIRYPISFPGKKRIVEVLGEAYFEVAYDALKPFSVITKGQVIEVLGTHFNVNAYDNEPLAKTTLLYGSIRISANGKTKKVKPGQQASVSHSDLMLTEVDPQESVAWKEGFFEFNDASIETIMRQISRWYDVDVVFEGRVSTETFTGRVSKFLDIHEVLALVKSPKLHINLKGRRIMIKE
ncbi:MAG: FecR domain-containing protein [Sphingobacteriaceae bacterium]|nr:FecR domain-containing protein [Sphingobacteriaceae bacterium]